MAYWKCPKCGSQDTYKGTKIVSEYIPGKSVGFENEFGGVVSQNVSGESKQKQITVRKCRMCDTLLGEKDYHLTAEDHQRIAAKEKAAAERKREQSKAFWKTTKKFGLIYLKLMVLAGIFVGSVYSYKWLRYKYPSGSFRIGIQNDGHWNVLSEGVMLKDILTINLLGNGAYVIATSLDDIERLRKARFEERTDGLKVLTVQRQGMQRISENREEEIIRNYLKNKNFAAVNDAWRTYAAPEIKMPPSSNWHTGFGDLTEDDCKNVESFIYLKKDKLDLSNLKYCTNLKNLSVYKGQSNIHDLTWFKILKKETDYREIEYPSLSWAFPTGLLTYQFLIDRKGNPITTAAPLGIISYFEGQNAALNTFTGYTKNPTEWMARWRARHIFRFIRNAANKPEGKLNKADYEKVAELSLSAEQLAETDSEVLNKLSNLEVLRLTTIDGSADAALVAKVPKIKSLSLTGQFTNLLSLTKLPQLEEYRYGRVGYNSKEKDLNYIASLAQLKRLHLGRLRIKDISALSSLVNLEYLDLSGNYLISNVDALKGMTQLKELRISQNQIEDLSPLKGLVHLERLDAEGNRISNLYPLIQLNQLKDLRLSGNRISNLIPLSYHKQLKELWIQNNHSLLECQIDQLRKSGPWKIFHNAKRLIRGELKDKKWSSNAMLGRTHVVVRQMLGNPAEIKGAWWVYTGMNFFSENEPEKRQSLVFIGFVDGVVQQVRFRINN